MGTIALISKHDHGIEAKPLVMRSEKQSDLDEIHIDSVGQQAKVHPGLSHIMETRPQMLVATGHQDVSHIHASAKKKQVAEQKQVAKESDKSSRTHSMVGSSDPDGDTLEDTTTTTLPPPECVNETSYKRCRIQFDHECASPDKNMSENSTTIKDCAAMVSKNSGKFFSFGTGSNDGACKQEFPETEVQDCFANQDAASCCPQTWTRGKFDYWIIISDDAEKAMKEDDKDKGGAFRSARLMGMLLALVVARLF